jgi:hypothetical protein
MRLPAVDLYDDSLAMPDEIELHLFARNRDAVVDRRPGKSGLSRKPQKSLLQFALGAVEP